MDEAMESGCEAVRAQLEAYLDQELPPHQMCLVLQHMATCEACADRGERAYQELAALREIIQGVAVPAPVRAWIMSSVGSRQ